MGTQKAVQVLIDGRVQGVGFRWSCSTVAERLGVRGWIRNLPDGRVEAHFEGNQDQLDQILRWAHEGPSYASVRSVTVTDGRVEGMRNFSVA
ncbi:acylphosphatase [Propionibacterium sp.]|uniref:acylphosphatase n=1 Tax=Propionibacterium sp. TaxID=1977903 RepID=UPI0039E7DA1B